jgi:hypothetical protein
MDGHDRTRRILERRLTTTRAAAAQWQDGDTTALMETLERSGDDALTCDFLRWLRADRRPSVMTLDFCSRILPLVLSCIRSKSIEVARGGLNGAQFMLRTFEGIILQTREVGSQRSDRAPVDFSLEERIRKCEVCHRLFRDIWDELECGRPAMKEVAPLRKDVLDTLAAFVSG